MWPLTWETALSPQLKPYKRTVFWWWTNMLGYLILRDNTDWEAKMVLNPRRSESQMPLCESIGKEEQLAGGCDLWSQADTGSSHIQGLPSLFAIQLPQPPHGQRLQGCTTIPSYHNHFKSSSDILNQEPVTFYHDLTLFGKSTFCFLYPHVRVTSPPAASCTSHAQQKSDSHFSRCHALLPL